MTFPNSLSRRPRRSLVCLAVIAAMATGTAAAGDLDPELRAAYSDRVQFDRGAASEAFDSFIVYYRNDAAGGDETSAAARLTRRSIDAAVNRINQAPNRPQTRYERRLATGGHLLRIAGGKLARSAAESYMVDFAADPDVVSIEPNARMVATAVPDDTQYTAQWGLWEPAGGINVESAWDVASGSGIVIAVIDTGSTTHPDLNTKYVAGYDFISDATAARDGSGRDANPADKGDWVAAGDCGADSSASNSSWHGTHVAGIAAALTNNAAGVAGVAYASRIQPVRVLGRCGGSTADIAEAIIWASGGSVAGVPANATPARVLNLSLGGSGACGTTSQNAINAARARNAIVVVAAGNDNEPVAEHNPGNCAGVISVAATNRTGQRASYSNYGSTITVAAPGGDSGTGNGIMSTVNAGTTIETTPGYGYKAGTSMATPFVAGVAALALGRNPALTPTQMEALLRNTSRPFPSNCTGGCGPGIVDANAAVRAATGSPVAQFPLTVTLAGNGLGTVTSTPSAISCGSACSKRFAAGSSVTLRATPAAGYELGSWSGACSGSAATCVVTVNQARTVTAHFRVPVFPLNNGSIRTNLAVTGAIPLVYALTVPAGATNLRFQISGGTGDADLYVRRGIEPTSSSYDCRPYTIGNEEACTFLAPNAGTYYVMLDADPTFSGVTLQASYAAAPLGGPQLVNGTPVSGLSAPAGGARYFRLVVPAGAAGLRIATQGGTGDLDLYVRRDGIPTATEFHCASEGAATTEACTAAAPTAGTYYILLRAYTAFSGVTLIGSYSPTKSLTINWAGLGGGSVAARRTATGDVGGTCAVLPCSVPLLINATFDLVPTASPGSTFAGWATGDCDSVTAQGYCRLNMNRARSVTPRFMMTTPGSAVVTISKSGSGSGQVGINRVVNGVAYGRCTAFPCRFAPLANVTYELTAVAASNSRFLGWLPGECASITPTGNCRILTNRPLNLAARFQPL